MDIEQLQEDILQETDINRLYEMQIDLSKLIKNAHTQNIMADTIMEQSEAKGNLGIYYAMSEVLQSRISEIKETDRANRSEDGRINYNFRMAAKTCLEKKTYQSIMDLAVQSRKEVKEQRKDLRQNKLQ